MKVSIFHLQSINAFIYFIYFKLGNARFTGSTPFYPSTTHIAFGFYVKESIFQKGIATRQAKIEELRIMKD